MKPWFAMLIVLGICLLCPPGPPTPALQAAPAALAQASAPVEVAPPAEGDVPRAVGEAHGPQEGQDEAGPSAEEALVQIGRDSFVVVRIWYKKDTDESIAADESNWKVQEIYREYVDQKRCQELAGIVVKNDLVLIADEAFERRLLDRVEIQTSDGQTFPAKWDSLLLASPCVLLKVDAKAAAALKPVRFLPLEANELSPLVVAGLHKDQDQWQLYLDTVRPSVVFSPAGPRNVFYGYSGSEGPSPAQSAEIVADECGNPVGVSVTDSIDLLQTRGLWKGPDILKARTMTFEELAAAELKARKGLSDTVHEVVIRLHQGEREPFNESDQASGKELRVYGVAISDKDILVPQSIDRRLACRVDQIQVTLSAGERRSADFVGVLQDVGAFVVRLRDGKLPRQIELADKDLPLVQPFWEVLARKKFGSKYLDFQTNRIVGKDRGYAGAYYPSAAQDIRPGSLLIDFDGRLAGICLQPRQEDDEQKHLERNPGFRSFRYRQQEEDHRIFAVSELRGSLLHPTEHLDTKIQVMPRQLAKRRAWFGVEYVSMTGDLAEQMKVESLTSDGKIGFLVNAVYAGSPAEKLGVQVGDILLKLQAPGMPYPIELASPDRQNRQFTMRFRVDGQSDGEPDLGPMEPSWKDRDNFLTQALDSIGVGKTVAFTYCRPDDKAPCKAQRLEYKIELAPPDQDSAAKWINRKLGLTVKDVTYEVRHALNLKAGDGGVMVAKVEEGSPTLIARIFPNELITQLNDTLITSAAQMRSLVAKARQAGQKKVRLTVLRLGKTRFADLNITEYSADEDEGLDETSAEYCPVPATAPASASAPAAGLAG